MRELRPDIIIELNGRVLVIIDAKYKNYHLFGKTATEGIQREDLYQMSTYLYHYGTSNKAIAGIFTSPVCCQIENVYCMKHNDLHYIGLINLNIEDKETPIDTHLEEISYVKRIEDILKRIE
jgi:5-methylcytosine-specific restriction endonuclease McrBC regulatory subunit McrC